MLAKVSIGELIIGYCYDFLHKYVSNMDYSRRKLNNREYVVYKLTPEVKKEFMRYLYRKLKEIIIKHCEIGEVLLSESQKSIQLLMSDSKPLWYRIGLALSDGSPLNLSSIMFTTSTSHTINAILRGFNNAKIYIAKYMVSKKTGKYICAFNIVVHDPKVADALWRIKRGSEVGNASAILKRNKDYLAQFLAGVIDGDGTIDRDNVRICVSLNDSLYSVINEIFAGKIRYGERKFMIRLSTKTLRELGIIDCILQYVVAGHKRVKLRRLLEKRTKFEPELDKHINKQLALVANYLSINELKNSVCI